jgi:hypothetical protein
MQDEAIHAFTPPPSAAAAAAAPLAPEPTARRRLWPWLLGAFLFLCLVAVMVSLTFLGLMDEARDGLNIVVDGESFRVTGPPGWEFGLGSILAGAVAVMVVLLVVPLVVLVGLLCMLLVVGLGLLAGAVGLAAGLACVLAVLALALSPLWGLALVMWLVLRRPKQAAAV